MSLTPVRSPQPIVWRLVFAVLAMGLTSLPSKAAALRIDGLSGPVAPAEITALKSWFDRFHPDPSNDDNAWAFGHSGQAVEALGAMYECTGDIDFLNRMIALASDGLAARNDLAPPPVGQRPLWPGAATPAWGNTESGKPGASHAGPETGDVVGRLAYCAYLILKTPAQANEVVPDGDPHQFGRTYGERALRLVRELDVTEDRFVIPWFVRTRDRNRFYYPDDKRYARSLVGDNNAGGPVPWNQQFMLANGLQRLAQCHDLLRDDPSRVVRYDGYVRSMLTWFLGELESHEGRHGRYVTWRYAPGRLSHTEDAVHAGIDVEGLYRCYVSGRYGEVLRPEEMVAFANDFVDILTQPDGHWAGMVDGTSKAGHQADTDFPRPNLLLLLEFRPDAYAYCLQQALSAKRTKSDITAITHLLWVRQRLFAARMSQTATATKR